MRNFRGEYLLPILILLAGINLSIWAAWINHEHILEQTSVEFKTAAIDRIELIEKKLNDNSIILNSLSSFFEASTKVSRGEFSTFTNHIIKNYPYIFSIGWVPRVTEPERSGYEKNPDYPGLIFTERNEAGRFVHTGVRNEYFPIYYIEPQSSFNISMLGFDVASNPVRYPTLQQAWESKQITVSERVLLPQPGKESIPGVIFFKPVFKTPGRNTAPTLTGFVASVVTFKAMIDASLATLSYCGVNIVIHDLSSNQKENDLLYVRSTRLKNIPEQEILNDYQNPPALIEKRIIEVGGRKWQITILPARGYFNNEIRNSVYFILFSGLAFTFLLTFYVLGRIRENDRVRREVWRQTEELHQAKQKTETILLSSHDGIIGIDNNGNIQFCNLMACQMLKFSQQEMITKNHHTLLHSRGADGSEYAAEDCPIQHVLEYGKPCNIRDEVFWNKKNEAIQIEYSAAPIMERGKITGAVLVFRDVAEQRALERKLEYMAQYDQLTGLPNRTLFIEHLKGAILRAGRTNKKVGMVYLDLNGFKSVNDTLGHAAGDRLLMEFAQRLKDILRSSDIAARIGGDEFTFLNEDLANEQECLISVNRLKEKLARPFEISGQKFIIGASIGLAFYPDHGLNPDSLIANADAAMYQAKSNKSLPFVIYTPFEKPPARAAE